MTLDDALVDVGIAFVQVKFSIKLLSYCELDRIRLAEFDTHQVVLLEQENLAVCRTCALDFGVEWFRCRLSEARSKFGETARMCSDGAMGRRISEASGLWPGFWIGLSGQQHRHTAISSLSLCRRLQL